MPFKNREERNKYHRQYHRKAMNIFRLSLGGKCLHCGYDEIIEILEFAHKKDSLKKFDISAYRNHKKEDVVKELEKCILLCPNCHRIYDLSFDTMQSYPLFKITHLV